MEYKVEACVSISGPVEVADVRATLKLEYEGGKDTYANLARCTCAPLTYLLHSKITSMSSAVNFFFSVQWFSLETRVGVSKGQDGSAHGAYQSYGLLGRTSSWGGFTC